MKKAFFLLLLLPVFAMAQDKGMHFEHGLSWAEVQAKAKAENKYIFMDCFTTWCGPCKYMSANIFPLEEVGTFMNSKYINVKVQMDKTDKDNEEVKKWYDDAKMLEEKYSVRAYPTFLVFAPDGSIADRLVGGSDAKEFVTRFENALKPEKQYYTQLAAYDKGRKDPAFIKELAMMAQSKYDQKNAAAFSKLYLDQQKDLFTEENLKFVNQFTNSSKDKGFQMFMDNMDKVNKTLGAGAAEKKLTAIVAQEEVFPNLMKKDAAPDWTAIDKAVSPK